MTRLEIVTSLLSSLPSLTPLNVLLPNVLGRFWVAPRKTPFPGFFSHLPL